MSDPLALMRATWPPLSTKRCGPFLLQEGPGGGKRVEAAICEGEAGETDIVAAERAMDRAGRQALFALTPEQVELDRMLVARGYLTLDPTLALSCPVDMLKVAPPPVSGFLVWPPLRVMLDIWEEGGIGPGRVAVMDRVKGGKAAILGRVADRPAGAAFVAVSDNAAMVHALEVRQTHRRMGLGRHMMAHAARWAAAQGAAEIVVLVTEANVSAIAFYEDLGMRGRRCYHYRVRP